MMSPPIPFHAPSCWIWIERGQRANEHGLVSKGGPRWPAKFSNCALARWTHSIRIQRYSITKWSSRPWSISSQLTGLPANGMRLVLEKYYNELRLLTVPNKNLKSEGFSKCNKVSIVGLLAGGTYQNCWKEWNALIRQRCCRESACCQYTYTERHMWESIKKVCNICWVANTKIMIMF